TIIGDGNGIELVRDEVKRLSLHSFNHVPYVEPKNLDRLLLERSDILFGMGTSTLDGAKNGIPTVVVQPRRHASDGPSETYRWVFQSKGYSLGEFFGAAVMPAQECYPLDSMLRNFYEQPTEIAERCYAYSRNFFLDNVFS